MATMAVPSSPLRLVGRSMNNARPSLLVRAALVAAASLTFPSTAAAQASYCGANWAHASSQCLHPCGSDDECAAAFPDEEYKCFRYTDCPSVVEEANDGNNGNGGGNSGNGNNGVADGRSDNYCGVSWLTAMLACQSTCPLGSECTSPQETCYAATGCHRPLETLKARLVTTMIGADSTMDDVEGSILEETLRDLVANESEELGIYCGGVDMDEQTLVGRRELRRRRRHLELLTTALEPFEDHVRERSVYDDVGGRQRRKLPIGSSALDVSVVITGEYRPPPYVEWDLLAEDSINRNGANVVKTLRERGERAGRDFFDRVESLEAVREVEKTERPTRSPVRSPTWSPIGPPTGTPSAMPSYPPSAYPSTAPTRVHHQVVSHGTEIESLQLGGDVTSSFGLVFNVRTKPDAGVVLVTGFDFYVDSTNEVVFELWSRVGSFAGHRGTYEGWDVVASGTLVGKGVEELVSIPEDMYTPVSIPGGGGTRAFYLTLQSLDLVYMLGDLEDGASDKRVHAETPDLEVWEGEAVLLYPFPDPKDKFLYRAPRQYLGSIHYDRLPCRPLSLYGPVDDYPCPEVPTGSPTVPPPTKAPSIRPTPSPSYSPVHEPTKLPSRSPTLEPIAGQTPAPVEPTEYPTASPTSSMAPTAHPTTGEPTFAPVVPMRAYIVTTLRNVPERSMTEREVEKYVETLTEFLGRHTESSMVLDGIDMWHQELILVDVTEEMVAEDAEGLLQMTKPQSVPQIATMEVQLVLKVSASNLPVELLGSMASATIDENEEELLDLLREQQAFYTFFKLVDGVESRTIHEVTNPPSQAPTTMAYWEAMQASLDTEVFGQETEEAKSRMGFGVFIGLGIGLLWCCLTAISVAYLLGARVKMEEQHDVEHLLEAEKADPLKNNTMHDSDTAPDVVVRPNDLDDPELWDQCNNTHLSATARAILLKSHHDKPDASVHVVSKQRLKGTRSQSLSVSKIDSGTLHSDRGLKTSSNHSTRKGRERGKRSRSMPRLKEHSMGSTTTESSLPAQAKRWIKKTRSQSQESLKSDRGTPQSKSIQKLGSRRSTRKGGDQDKHPVRRKDAKEANEDAQREAKRRLKRSRIKPTTDLGTSTRHTLSKSNPEVKLSAQSEDKHDSNLRRLALKDKNDDSLSGLKQSGHSGSTEKHANNCGQRTHSKVSISEAYDEDRGSANKQSTARAA